MDNKYIMQKTDNHNEILYQNYGVSQGEKLSPLLYLSLINHCSKMLLHLYVVEFVCPRYSSPEIKILP